MARPRKGYYNAAGKRVPGSTTITGHRKGNGEGLLYWANNLGREGIDHRDARQKAANSGTLVHTMVEDFINGKAVVSLKWALAHKYTEEQYEAALIGFEAARKWLSQTTIKVVEQEMPMISEKYQFGGTPDAIGVLPDAKPDEFVLLDWKTGKLYPTDHIPQIASYRTLWEEYNPGKKIVEVHLCHFGKEFGEFGHHAFPLEVIDLGWTSFLHMLEMYRIDKQLKKVS